MADNGLPDHLRRFAELMADVRKAMAKAFEPVVQPPVEPAPKLVAKLMEIATKNGWDSSQPPFGSPEYARAMLTGVPVERVADSLNKRELYGVTKAIANLRATAGILWDPDRWLVICPPYLLEWAQRIDGVEVRHDTVVPDWSVLLIQVVDTLLADLDPAPDLSHSDRFAPPYVPGPYMPGPVLNAGDDPDERPLADRDEYRDDLGLEFPW